MTSQVKPPRPGFVLDVDRSTPPVLFHHGENFRLEKLPPGRSRVIYPSEPLEPLEDIEGAIRHALLNPEGDSAPLPDLLRPGMKLTIAFDDISLPLPPMRRPDIRQRVIEQVLDLAAAAGVDDVELIAALALHRRMTEDELRHAVGDRVYDSFAPHGLLYNHDAEDLDNLTLVGTTDQGEEVEINKRAAESDLLVYVNLNIVSMDGGWKSTATGLASYRSIRHHHNVKTMQHSKSFMDRHHSELHSSNWRMGKVLRDAGVKVFQIETTINNNVFGTEGPLSVLQKREWEWSGRDRLTFLGLKTGLDAMSARQRRTAFQNWKAPHQMTSVQAGEVEAVHEKTTEMVLRQHLVPVEGQTDILTMGLPYICPYNVNSIMNPILVMCLGLGYFFNLYRGRPPVREGGVLIMSHPTPWEFHPVHHPSYIDFFEQVLAETTDPIEIEQRFEVGFATDEWYRHLYRTSYAYHGVHPFYMWYWGAHALQHLGRVIIVGGDTRAVRRLGFMPASTLQDALEMASDTVGRDASITHLHNPPVLMADVT
jgi:lactate racemase